MNGSLYKRCACKDPAGKLLGRRCPKLRRPDGRWAAGHGTWGYQTELPTTRGGQRRPHRPSGYSTSAAAQQALDHIRALLALADPTDPDQAILIGDLIKTAAADRVEPPTVAEVRTRLHTGTPASGIPTVADYLSEWLAGRRSLADNTRRSYESHLRKYLIPHLGPIRLDRLRLAHLNDMVDAIADQNALVAAGRDSDDPAERAAVRGLRILGPGSLQRVRATLRKALNDAIRHGLITTNPARHLELAPYRRPKPRIWTPERVARWQATGAIPAPVMVWTPELTGQFLDSVTDDRLYALYHLIAHRGLRRGEACGVHWTDLALDHHTLTISWQIVQHGWNTELAPPKTDDSERVIALDEGTVAALRAHRARQAQERLAAGPAWTDTDLVFTNPDGTALHPATVTEAFHTHTAAAGLPPVRLHDLRHGAATLALATGADMKIIQAMLGHSTITITADTYTDVLPELARTTAEAVARLIPRASAAGDS